MERKEQETLDPNLKSLDRVRSNSPPNEFNKNSSCVALRTQYNGSEPLWTQHNGFEPPHPPKTADDDNDDDDDDDVSDDVSDDDDDDDDDVPSKKY